MTYLTWPFRGAWQESEGIQDIFDTELAEERFEPPGEELRKLYAGEMLVAIREDEIHLLSGAEKVLGSAVERLVEYIGDGTASRELYRKVAARLYRHMYHVITSGVLVLVIGIPQTERKAYVEIPAHLWSMKAGGRYVN
ncbi:hypothetical protein [Oleidesulfovibrio sp.]|uniref:hypothetical protein n=1 Tax=Oleidesulfovibrio sp. TaxID=2909707 RepID=UPI003A89A2C2